MDEQPITATPLWKRLGLFFGFHLSLDLLSLIPLIICLVLMGYSPEEGPRVLLPYLPILLIVAAYFPLGMLAAKWSRWSVPSLGSCCLTVLLPAGLLLLLTGLGFAFPLPISTGSASFVLLLLLAAPQSAFLFSSNLLAQRVGVEVPAFVPLLTAWLFLPSLLFTLGSAWQSRRHADPSH